ncbi:MAG TPA: peptide ABC transporter substrate-binding protein [Phycisphaerales bacterium]|nr:peptide ABC transporter substrate-binding protein [Phycisphaerales bacterium]
MAKLLVPFAILLAIVFGALLSDRPAPRADFTFINRGEVTTMDVAIMSWQMDFRVARILYEGLTRHDPLSHSFRSVPGVAERWDVSPDQKTWTFHLRGNAKWSNGQPVRAGDFVFSWRRTMLPDNSGDYSQIFNVIRGVREFQSFRTRQLAEFSNRTDIDDRRAAAEQLWKDALAEFDRLVAIRTPDDRTIIIELEQPVPYFLELTGFGSFFPVYPPLVMAHESFDEATGRLRTDPDWTKPPKLITNGPFTMTVWRFMRDIRMEKNPHYWDKASINIDSIAIPNVDDVNAQVMAFTTGAVDWVSDVIPAYRADMLAEKQQYYKEHWDEYQRLKSLREHGRSLDPIEIDRRLPPDPRKNIHAFPAFGTYFYNFNCRPRLSDGRINPFHDPRVRKAFALATDKEAIVKNLRRTGEPVATTIIPPSSIGGYSSPQGLPYDPTLARQLLADAGFPGGKGFITVEILFNKDGGHEVYAQAIAKNWQEHLGVQVVLAQKEIKVLRDQLKNADYIISRGSWFGDYGYPTTFLDISRSDDGNNDRKYENPAYDALLDRAKSAPPAEAMQLLQQAERLLVEDELPILPIFHYVDITLFDPHKVAGLSTHPRQNQHMYLIDILGDGKGADLPRPMHE